MNDANKKETVTTKKLINAFPTYEFSTIKLEVLEKIVAYEMTNVKTEDEIKA